MASDHYFTSTPASQEERRSRLVDLAGQRVSVVTARGVFSPDRVDPGTAVLLREAPPPPPSGTFLDLGCGWGPVALTLGLLSPAATIYAVDVNERALDLARTNAAALGLVGIHPATPAEVPEEVRFDVIWSNPPIRVGKPVLHDMLETWLPRLQPGGAAYLVVQKNLGADSLQKWVEQSLELRCARYAVGKGYRVLEVTRAG